VGNLDTNVDITRDWESSRGNVRKHGQSETNQRKSNFDEECVALVVYWLVCWPLGPKVAGSKPGQGDGFLRAIKIRSTPSSRMGSKAGRSHVVRFYGM
jgi:hypothetical protein